MIGYVRRVSDKFSFDQAIVRVTGVSSTFVKIRRSGTLVVNFRYDQAIGRVRGVSDQLSSASSDRSR